MSNAKTNPIAAIYFRGFALVNGRKIHYRRWGNGPAVIALHGSPQSSRVMETLGPRLANAGLCLIAPDTPGNGLSEPLAQALQGGALTADSSATITDYADTLIAFADAIGLGRFGLYGFHGGAAIAATAAARNPERVCALVGDGLPDWTDEERSMLLNGYLPPFLPAWDGSHLSWLWARLEEQTVFFPWHIPTATQRMNYNVSPPAQVHANAMDLLQAGDNYRAPYHAAFCFKPTDYVPRITAPTLITALQMDPLATHCSRPVFQQLPHETFATIDALYSTTEALMCANQGDPAPTPQACPVNAEGITGGWVTINEYNLAWTGAGWSDTISSSATSTTKSSTTTTLSTTAEKAPLVLLHNAGGSKNIFNACLAGIGQSRAVIALDLPGHGDSERLAEYRNNTNLSPTFSNIETLGRYVADACQALGLKDYAVAGLHLGGQIAAWLVNHGYAKNGAALSSNIISAEDHTSWTTHYAPSLTPEWDGAHLVRAFRIARWEQLFFPWFKRESGHRINALPASLEPANIQQRAVNLLRAGNYWQAAVQAEAGYDLQANLPSTDKFTVYAIANDPRSAPDYLKALTQHTQPLAADPSAWVQTLTIL